MRELSSTLLTAQRSASSQPYVKVTVTEQIGGVTRLNWNRLYSGSEPDHYHSAVMAGDGSLIRARVSNSSPYWLYIQRVTNPGPGSDFSQWASFTQVSGSSGIALASQGADVLIFFVDSNGQTVKYAESNDYGASFGSPVTILTASGTVGWLAADFNGAGAIALFYSVGVMLYAVKKTGGSWGSPTVWTNSLSTITGLGCIYAGDWNLSISGQDSSNSNRIWSCIYGDGYSQGVGEWSSVMELTGASPNSGVEFRCPSLAYPDVFRLFFIEKYSGSEAYSRPLWSHSLPTAEFSSNLWREPVPFDLGSTCGVAITYSGNYSWLSCPFGVWRASLTPASAELTADVLTLETESLPFSGRARIELRNDDGRYNNPGSDTFAALQAGSELQVSPGYFTSIGQEFSIGPTFWIEGWEYASKDGRSIFIIHASDGWGLLENWRARRQFSWTAGSKNIFQLLSFILARSGLEYTTLSNSSTLTDIYPSFTINPQESGARAVGRLLAMAPDVLFFRGGCGYSLNPQISDNSVYSYGSSHAIISVRHNQARGINRVQVYGNGVASEGFFWPGLVCVYDRLHQVHDLNLDTVAKAQGRVGRELRHLEINSVGGDLIAPANCGQELYDVIDITDSQVGLSQAKRRVLGLNLIYSAGRRNPLYQHRIRLGGA